ncbi:hypothetical protein KCP74_10655 [Salmonella enterica subsp. enterica]|nr:hypothetical protein KCP74_10655 [Salmonella enterica subsp. enterica]
MFVAAITGTQIMIMHGYPCWRGEHGYTQNSSRWRIGLSAGAGTHDMTVTAISCRFISLARGEHGSGFSPH